MAWAIAAQAVKMQPGTRTIRQSDGTTISVRGMGNHDLHYYVTTDGVLLCLDGNDFVVAQVDGEGMLRPTGILAHENGLRGAEELKAVAAQDTRRFAERMEANISKARMHREPMGENATLLPHLGSPRVPVILVEFTDTTFTVPDTRNTFDKYLNKTELYDREADADMGTRFGAYGSVKRYFEDMSFGKFSPDFDVYGPVKLPNELKHYGANTTAAENMTGLLNDACRAVDADVDFSKYDTNGDGNIDLVYIIYAGYSESINGNSAECIYPKSGTLSGSETFDGVKVCRYGVSNELNATPEEQQAYGLLINGIGLFCHEFSHCLGLPDLYPSPTSTAVRCINHNLDYWDLMDAGEYTQNGYRPTELSSWERERFEWLTIDTLSAPCDVTLSTLAAGGKAYRILNDKDETGHEYYIVENVQRQGWNRYLPGHGMLVYHVDYDSFAFTLGGCRVNNTAGHPRMTVLAADGMFIPEYFIDKTIKEGSTDIEKEANATLIEKYGGEVMTYTMYQAEQAGDPYPGTSAATELTDASAPMAAWVYNGGHMGKPLTGITEDTDAKTVSFKFMGGAETGIHNIVSDGKELKIYSMDGRYLGTDPASLGKGLYIIGNKKVVM